MTKLEKEVFEPEMEEDEMEDEEMEVLALSLRTCLQFLKFVSI